MLMFFQIMVWTMAAALILYVYASWRYEAKVKEKCLPSVKRGIYYLYWAPWSIGHMILNRSLPHGDNI